MSALGREVRVSYPLPVASSDLSRQLVELRGSQIECARMSAELEVQKAYFRQLFANAPEGIVLIDNDDRVVDANAAFEELFQYDLGEIACPRIVAPRRRSCRRERGPGCSSIKRRCAAARTASW